MAIQFHNHTKDFLSKGLEKRESLSKYQNQNQDFDKMDEEIEKDIQFAMTMMIKSIQNQIPGEKEDGDAAKMLETSNQILSLKSVKTQGKQMAQMVEAITNPGYSAAEIQGQQIEYDDAKRVFDGKNPVEFKYNIDFNDQYASGTVNTTISIKDSSGKVVYVDKDTSKKGDNKFIWNGKSKGVIAGGNSLRNDETMPMGSYTMEIKAIGTKNDKPFDVKASTTKLDVVKYVELENGIPTKLHLESGRNIDKTQIKTIHAKKPEILKDYKADFDILEKKVSLDFSKATIENGSMKIYYNNNIEDHHSAKIIINDSRGLAKQQIDFKDAANDDKLKYGLGEIVLKDEIAELQDGKYTVEIVVTDNNNKKTTLDPKYKTTILGVHKTKPIIYDNHERAYPAELIETLETPNYTSVFNQTRAGWIGKNIEFESNEFTYSGSNIEFTHDIPMPEAEGSLYQTKMFINDSENNLVNIINHNFNPKDIVTEEAAAEGEISGVQFLNNIAQDKYNEDFDDVAEKDKSDLYSESFQKLLLNDNKKYIQKEYQSAENRKHKYVWNGEFDSSKILDGQADKAVNGSTYTIRLEHRYIGANGAIFSDEDDRKTEDIITSHGTIKELTKDDRGNVDVILTDGRTIPETNVIFGKSAMVSTAEENEQKEIQRIQKIVEAINNTNSKNSEAA